MSNNLKGEINQIEIPTELSMRVLMGVDQGFQIKSLKKRKVRKRWGYGGLAVAALAFIFISSAYVSPSMAQVVSKIPYLNKIFDSNNSFLSEITNTLAHKGYIIKRVSANYGDSKRINVVLPSDSKYSIETKKKITEIVKQVCLANGYDAYSIEFSNDRRPNISSSDEKEAIVVSHFLTDVHKELNANKLNILNAGIRYDLKTLEVEIPSTEIRIDDIKKVIASTERKYHFDNKYKIKIKKVDMSKRELSQRWDPIISAISEGLIGKKEFKVSNVGFSNTSDTISIYIYTDILQSSNSMKEDVQRIKSEVNSLLNSDEIHQQIKEDKYDIEILSKDKKKIY